MLLLPLDHILHLSTDQRRVRDAMEATCFLPNDNTNNAFIYTFYIYSDVTLFHIRLVLVFHLAGCLSASELYRPSL